MSTSYLHGVETKEVTIGGQTVQIVKSSVVAIIGIAPMGLANTLTLCSNDTDDAQFGKALPGFNIPKTLQIIRSIAGGAPILVVNVFDSAANTVAVTVEPQSVVNGKLKLAFVPIGDVSIFATDGITPATIVKGVDYTLDAFGNFQAISSNITNGTVYKFTYKKLDGTTVNNTQIIGGVAVDGTRTGLSLFDVAFNTFGFNPKIFIAPEYSSTAAIATAMATAAKKFRSVYLLDAGFGVTVAQAIAGRGLAGSLAFNTSDERAILLYPYLKTYDDYSQADGIYPYSAFMAGVIIATDALLGYWYSPSNKVIPNASGAERIIQWGINDPNCEANQLNGVGITTIAAGFGTGILSWGNRNASFPTSSSVKNFIAIRRADDMVIESMELASLPYLDLPITQAQIDTIRESGNAFIRTLISRGAVLPGSKVLYSKGDNPASELAAGHITFERVYMVGTPTELVTYNDILDISLLNQFS